MLHLKLELLNMAFLWHPINLEFYLYALVMYPYCTCLWNKKYKNTDSEMTEMVYYYYYDYYNWTISLMLTKFAFDISIFYYYQWWKPIEQCV